MPTHKSEDYKLSAVEYYLTEDKTQEEVCKIFKCSARSLLRWVDKYNENGEIKRHNRKPVAYKVHKNQVKFILDEIKKNKTIEKTRIIGKFFLRKVICRSNGAPPEAARVPRAKNSIKSSALKSPKLKEKR